MKNIKHIIEYILFIIIFSIFRLLPINLVSIIGSNIFRLLGRYSKSNTIALSNIKKSLPNIKNKELKKNIDASWSNIGKTFSELSILPKIAKKRLEIKGLDNIKKTINKNKQIIFFGIHQANWEVIVPALDKIGLNVVAIYRHINNPLIDKYILNKRISSIKNKNIQFSPKGKKSAKDMINAINNNKSIVLLIDQKDNTGKKTIFFNQNVKTQTGFLKIALKYKLELVPIQVKRKNINNLSVIFHKPFNKNYLNDEILLMNKINSLIEKWIKEKPDQWLWQHNRFN